MKILFRIIAVLLFVVFFGFALKNTHEASLYLFAGTEIRAPMVMLLLLFCVGGAAMGILAMIPTVFRYRRDLAKQKKALATLEQEREKQRNSQANPPQPDFIEAH